MNHNFNVVVCSPKRGCSQSVFSPNVRTCRPVQSGGKRSWSLNLSRTCGRTSSFWRGQQVQEWQKTHVRLSERTMACSNGPLTISTSFSKKGTNFSSSLSFLSINQLSMGIPFDSCRGRQHQQSEQRTSTNKAVKHTDFWEHHLIGKGLWWIIYDDGLW